MDLIEIGAIVIGLLVAVFIVHWALTLRQIVELKYADVVVKKAGTKIYLSKLFIVLLILIGAIVSNFMYDMPALGVWIAIIIGAFFGII